ncbi:aspartate kinase [Haliangium sp.]|uniref:aspartate kinase n=1 Tax=Haliangium sp. TaxID=2663208 RepID=UPI003D0ABBC6
MIVMKFGGSSVANRDQIDKVLNIVRGRRGQALVVVCSAHKGITNALVDTARDAAEGRYAPEPVIERQQAIAAELGCADELLAPFYGEIRDLLRGISLVRELSPRSFDYITSFGERMSVRCIADYFVRRGLAARAYDVWDLGFITDRTFGRARPLPGYEATMKAAFAALPADEIPMVTGYVGKSTQGDVTAVGRNGSDLTATLIAAALGADEVQIWSDTDGVLTADPSVVDGARNIPLMHFGEAAELAYFGSRALHPSSLVPAMSAGVPVRVLNTNRPEHPGTVIDDHSRASESVTSIAYKENQIAVTLRSTRMFGQAGFLAQVFDILGRHGVVVDLIATSEISVSMTLTDGAALDRALPELSALGECRVVRGKTLLVVVGQSLAHRAGLGAAILGATAEAGVNVEMISYGLHSINFSMVIDDADIDRAVPVLHRMLFEDRPPA